MSRKANAMTKEKIQVSNSSYVIHCKDYESTFQQLVFLKTRSTLDNNLKKQNNDKKRQIAETKKVLRSNDKKD